MKKLLLLLVMILLPMVASADKSGTCGENLTWELVESTGTLTISGSGAMTDYTSGSSPWNEIRENIKKLVIDNGITSIGNSAFWACSALASVTIPNSVTAIGNYAFQGTGLTSVTIPNNVTAIGKGVFSQCSALTSVTIPNSVTSIGERAFLYSSALTSITIPNGVTSIGNNTFNGCSGLTSITIPNSVTSIGENVFYGCTSLTSITIPNSVTSIGENVFYGCTSLTSITIPNSVTSIGARAFNGCTNLTSVTIPNSLKIIAYEAFKGCTGLISVTIPNSVTSIGQGAFQDCSGLNSVTIPNSVTSIYYYAFHNCSGLASVTIPNSVESIAPSAFSGCSNLTSVTIDCNKILSGSDWLMDIFGNQVQSYIIGNSVNAIGEYAFHNCSGITSVTIPNSVTSIGGYAFDGCSSLTSVTIPNSVTSIDEGTFQNCSGLTSITIGNSVESIGGNAFIGCSGLTSVTIPNSVTSIGLGAFSDCSGLTSVTIPNSVTFIGAFAFENCKSLSSITIPKCVTSIDANTFRGCTNLTSVTIPNSVTYIVYEAFSGCSGLTSITIPNSVTSIGESAFSGCTGLTSVTIPNSVTSIGVYAFHNCKSLPSITIPKFVTSINANTFSGCSGLTSITIPNSVTSIGESAFSGCTGLTSVTIPNSVTSIGARAFNGCTNLNSVTVEINTPISITNDVFTNRANSTLYVPEGSKASYEAANYWRAFKNIITFGSEVVANNLTRVYGKTNPKLTYTINGDEISGTPVLTCEASETSPVGTYDILISKGTISNSHVFFKKGILTINPKVVSISTITLSQTSYTYDGTAKEPTVTVKDGETIIPADEYIVSYSDNTNVGTATVTITGKEDGNYIVNGSTTFTINIRTVSDPTFTFSENSCIYNGTAKEPTVTVKDGETIIPADEYIVSYSDNTNVGTATVTITDKEGGNYNVNGSTTFTIAPKTVSDPTVILSEDSYTYDGTVKEPTVTVKDGESVIPADEYTVSYTDNTNVGTATVTITDKEGGNYIVSGSTTFTINVKTVSDPTVTLSEDSYTYDGTEKEPTVTVKDGETIIPADEYTVSYSDNTNVGTATVTITDNEDGNYIVNGSTTFTINAKIVSDPTIILGESSYTYDGTAKEPTVTVKDGDTIIPADEYTVSYINNTNAGTATVTITDKEDGNYIVSGSTTFTIAPKTVSDPTVTLSEDSYIYDGTAKEPTVTVKDGETIIPVDEYTVSYDDNTNVGTATVTIKDKEGGNYIVSGSTTFTINVKTVSNPTVTLSEDSYTYDGTEKEPTVTVKDGETIISADEYTVSYSDNTNVGTATVTITDKEDGNYIVSGSTTFTIAPKTISAPTISLSPSSYSYDGNAKEPTVIVKDGETIVPADEYTVSYSDNTNAGTATVTITDKEGGNYNVSGSTTFIINSKTVSVPTIGNYFVGGSTSFTIYAKTVNNPTIILSTTSYICDGTAKEPTVTVMDDETVIPASEYTISYSNNTNVGTATVTITDKEGGNYIVSGSTTFTIHGMELPADELFSGSNLLRPQPRHLRSTICLRACPCC